MPIYIPCLVEEGLVIALTVIMKYIYDRREFQVVMGATGEAKHKISDEKICQGTIGGTVATVLSETSLDEISLDWACMILQSNWRQQMSLMNILLKSTSNTETYPIFTGLVDLSFKMHWHCFIVLIKLIPTDVGKWLVNANSKDMIIIIIRYEYIHRHCTRQGTVGYPDD